MKKIWISIVLVVGASALLLVPSFAAFGTDYGNYHLKETPPTSSTPEADHIRVMTVFLSNNYIFSLFDDVLIARYTQTGHLMENDEGIQVTASTEMKLEDQQFGQVRTYLTASSNEVCIVQSEIAKGLDCDNWLRSGSAIVYRKYYASHIVHSGWRATSSGDIEQYWTLTQ